METTNTQERQQRQPKSTTTAKRSSRMMMESNIDNDSYMKYKKEWSQRQEQLSELVKSIETMAENTIKSALKSYDDDDDDNDDVCYSKNDIPSETVLHKNKKLKRSPPDDNTMPISSATSATTKTTKNDGNMKQKLTMIQLKDTLKQLGKFHTKLKAAVAVVEQFQQRMEDELVLFCETSYSPLVSLGGDILSHNVMRYLDEDALIQCEYSSLVMNRISRGNDFQKQHWMYLQSLLFPERAPNIVDVYARGKKAPKQWETIQAEYCKRCPKYFSTFNQQTETLSLNKKNIEDCNDEKLRDTRYYGIIAAKARELEDHCIKFHPSRNFNVANNDNYYDVERTRTRPLCSCEEFLMKETTLEDRMLQVQEIRQYSTPTFVCISSRREGEGGGGGSSRRIIWQGFCDCFRYKDLNAINRVCDYRFELFNQRIPHGSWPILHQLANDLREQRKLFVAAYPPTWAGSRPGEWDKWANDNPDWIQRIHNQATTLAEGLRVTVVNQQGRLILSTGVLKDVSVSEGGESVKISLLPMICDHEERPEHTTVSLDIKIFVTHLRADFSRVNVNPS